MPLDFEPSSWVLFSSFHLDLTHWLCVIFKSVLALGVLGTRTLAGEVLGNTCAIVTCMWQVFVYCFVMSVCLVLVEQVTAILFANFSFGFCVSSNSK